MQVLGQSRRTLRGVDSVWWDEAGDAEPGPTCTANYLCDPEEVTITPSLSFLNCEMGMIVTHLPHEAVVRMEGATLIKALRKLPGIFLVFCKC